MESRHIQVVFRVSLDVNFLELCLLQNVLKDLANFDSIVVNSGYSDGSLWFCSWIMSQELASIGSVRLDGGSCRS